jgi:energy-coupling factor transporter ATP-binding protein EcfA2
MVRRTHTFDLAEDAMDSIANLPGGKMLLTSTGIVKVSVKELFGQYTYELTDKLARDRLASKALLLYGDNGSGKTTILKLLFYLLSHLDGKGHKTAASRIRFKEFTIEFVDGTRVSAVRADVQKAAYTLSIARGGQAVVSCSYPDTDSSEEQPNLLRGIVRGLQNETREKNHGRLLAALEEMQLGLIYLTDTRMVLSTVAEVAGLEEDDYRTYSHGNLVLRSRSSESGEAEQVTRAVEQISSWATRQAFKGSTQGEEDANSVYASVIELLATENPPAGLSMEHLVSELRAQEKRAEEFVRFGLTKPAKAEAIVRALLELNDASRVQALILLQPYVSGIEKRLDALDPIRAQLSSFTDLMNSFFGSSKAVQLNVNEGIRIIAKNSDVLAPAALSSGERQLLYLLASTIVAKEKSHIFMIDEPEISLNVRWQRKLVQALLDLTSDASMQFILATHSIELLAQYGECVLDLESVG